MQVEWKSKSGCKNAGGLQIVSKDGKTGCKVAGGVQIVSKDGKTGLSSVQVSIIRVQRASGLRIELQRDVQVEVGIDLSLRRVC